MEDNSINFLVTLSSFLQDIEMKKSQRKRRRVIVEEDSEEHLDYNENSMHDLVDDESSSELEGNTVWVQCENPECQKWRRITEQENLGELSEMKWICSMNKGTLVLTSYLVFSQRVKLFLK